MLLALLVVSANAQLHAVATFTTTIEQESSQVDPTNASPIVFEVTFGESIDATTFTAADLSISPVGLSVGAPVETSTDQTVYTVSVTGMSSGQTVSLSLAGSLVDNAGANKVNAASTSSDNSVTYDTTAPTATFSPSITNGDFTLTIDFGEDVTGFAASDIGVTNATRDDGSFSDDGGGSFSIGITNPTADVGISIAANAATDLADNGSTIASTTVTYDGTDPTTGLSPSADPTNGDFTLTITFGEDVTGFTASEISVTNATRNDASFAGGSGTYTIGITNPTADVDISIAAGACTDLAGNDCTAASTTVTYDASGPTPVLTPSSDPTNGDFTLTIDFGEDVTGFTASDIAVTNATRNDPSFSDDGGGEFTIGITSPTADVGISILASAATDLASNPSGAASTTVTYDNASPTPTLSSDTDPTDDSFVLTIDFGEEVTGFTASDISVNNGTRDVGSFSDDGGGVFTITINENLPADTIGTILVDIAASAATDLAGNASNAASQLSVTYDDLDPDVTVEQASGQADPTNSLPITFTVTFNEPINTATFNSNDITLQDGANVASGPTEIAPNDGTTFEFTVNNLDNNEDPAPTISDDRVSDLAGNRNTDSTSADNSVIYNNVDPDVDFPGGGNWINVNATGGYEIFWENLDDDDTGSEEQDEIASLTLYYITPAGSGTIPSDTPSGSISVATFTENGSVLFSDFVGTGTYRFQWVAVDTAGNTASSLVFSKVEDGLIAAFPNASGDTTVNGGTITWTLHFNDGSDANFDPSTELSDSTIEVIGFDSAADVTFIDDLDAADTDIEGEEVVTQIAGRASDDPAWTISVDLNAIAGLDDRVVRLSVSDTGTVITTNEGGGGSLDASTTDDGTGFIVDLTPPTVTQTGATTVTLNAASDITNVAVDLTRQDPTPSNGDTAAISGLVSTAVLDVLGSTVPGSVAGWNSGNATIVTSDATTTTLDLSTVIGADTELGFLLSFQATDDADNVSADPTASEVISVIYDAVLPDLIRASSSPAHNSFQDAGSLGSASITFAEDVSFVSDGLSAISLVKDGDTGAAVALDLSLITATSGTVTLPALESGSTYELLVGDGRIVDDVGNQNANSSVLRFYTNKDGPQITGSLVVTADGIGTTISTSQLGATLDGNAASNVYFRLLTAPAIGGLSLDGGASQIAAGTEWTLAAIQSDVLFFDKDVTEGGSTQFQVAVGIGPGFVTPTDTAWVSVSLDSINSAPSLTLPAGATYDAEAVTTVIYPLASGLLRDPEDLGGGTLTLSFADSDPDDLLDVATIGDIAVVGSTISYDDGGGAITIGQILDRGTELSIGSLQGNDAAMAALLDAISYDHADPASLLDDAAGRSIAISVTDGDGGSDSGSFLLYTTADDDLPTSPRMTSYGTAITLPAGATLDVELTADNPEDGQTLRFLVDDASLPAGLSAEVVDDDVLRIIVESTAAIGDLDFTLLVTDRSADWSTIITDGDFSNATLTVTVIDTAASSPLLGGDPPLTLPSTGSVTYRIDLVNRGQAPSTYSVSLIGIPPQGLSVATSSGQDAVFLLWNASSGVMAGSEVSYPCAIYAQRTASDAFIIPLTVTVEGLPGSDG